MFLPILHVTGIDGVRASRTIRSSGHKIKISDSLYSIVIIFTTGNINIITLRKLFADGFRRLLQMNEAVF
jgi:CheY-like chemotaxis protein